MRTAIVIVSYNSPEMTDGLVETIRKVIKRDNDIYVIDGGERKSEEADIWFGSKKGGDIRMTKKIIAGLWYSGRIEEWQGEFLYDSYWILVNDVILQSDVLTPMMRYIERDKMEGNKAVGMIHPAIENSPCQTLLPDGKIKKVSFVEFICPLFSREVIENVDLFDGRFHYGWGLDYEIPHLLFREGYRVYVDGRVSVIHNAGTTVKMGADKDFSTISEQFKASRENMLSVLREKYGKKWGQIFLDAIPPDVEKYSYRFWVEKFTGDYIFEEGRR